MAITQLNTYVPGTNNDITNAVQNIDYNRIGIDLTSVTFSGGNFLVKIGSIIEANGNLYVVDSADESITAATGNLVFNESTGFAISASSPVYREDKGGYYLADGATRVCRFALTAAGGISHNVAQLLFLANPNINVGGSLVVSGTTTTTNLDIVGNIISDVNVDGTLDVTGDTTLQELNVTSLNAVGGSFLSTVFAPAIVVSNELTCDTAVINGAQILGFSFDASATQNEVYDFFSSEIGASVGSRIPCVGRRGSSPSRSFDNIYRLDATTIQFRFGTSAIESFTDGTATNIGFSYSGIYIG